MIRKLSREGPADRGRDGEGRHLTLYGSLTDAPESEGVITAGHGGKMMAAAGLQATLSQAVYQSWGK